MKKVLAAAIMCVMLVSATLGVAYSASLGVAPSSFEVTISDEETITQSFLIYGYTGDLAVSPVDLPVMVSPNKVSVESSPGSIELSFSNLASVPGEYNGYVNFQASSNQTISLAVNIKARVNVQLSATIVEEEKEEATGETGGGGYYPIPLIVSTPEATVLAPTPFPEVIISTPTPSPEAATPTPTVSFTVIAPTPTPSELLEPEAENGLGWGQITLGIVGLLIIALAGYITAKRYKAGKDV